MFGRAGRRLGFTARFQCRICLGLIYLLTHDVAVMSYSCIIWGMLRTRVQPVHLKPSQHRRLDDLLHQLTDL